MTIGNEPCGNLFQSRIVTSEGFTQNTTAKCSNPNCLNEGVHPRAQSTPRLRQFSLLHFVVRVSPFKSQKSELSHLEITCIRCRGSDSIE